MKFSNTELKDLFYAWILISLAFAILLSGGFNFVTDLQSFAISLLVSGFTVGIGFLFHELMHKFVAQNYNVWAEFRAFYPGLGLAILFSFIGFIIAAPGGVMTQGRLTREQNGKISIAGPWTNIILALIFLPFLFFDLGTIMRLFVVYGFSINSLLAAFNLIPFSPFDGQKVKVWNPFIYYISLIIAVGLFIGSFWLI